MNIKSIAISCLSRPCSYIEPSKKIQGLNTLKAILRFLNPSRMLLALKNDNPVPNISHVLTILNALYERAFVLICKKDVILANTPLSISESTIMAPNNQPTPKI